MFPVWLVLAMSTVASAQPHYQVVDLGAFFPISIRTNGQMSGSLVGSTQMAARGTVSAIVNLGADGRANATNGSGVTVGYSGCYDAGCINQEATLWDSAGAAHLLGLLPGGYASAATGIYDSTKVGYGDDAQLVVHALRWQGSTMQVLPDLGGGDAYADAINSSGTIIGNAMTTHGEDHAVIWDADGTIHDLGTLGGTISVADALNDAGIVVGWSINAQNQGHAFRDIPGSGMHALPDPSGMFSCAAFGLNNYGTMVGSCEPNLGYPAERAVLWTPTAHAYDLNTRLVNGDGWVLEVALSINGAGQIVGSGTYQGHRRGFLLTPVIQTVSAM
jgi:probable HAF family extracellular repeat protein